MRRLQGGHSEDIAVEIDMAAVVNYIVIGLVTYVALQPVWYLVLHLTDQQRRDNASTAQQCIAPCALVLFYERECNPMAIFALFFGPAFTCFCYEQPDQAVLAREGIGQGGVFAQIFSCNCKKLKIMAGYADEEEDEDRDSDESSSDSEEDDSGDEEQEDGEDGDSKKKDQKKKNKKGGDSGAPQKSEMSRHRSNPGMAKDLKGGRRGSFIRISSASRNRVGSAKYFADQKKLERHKSRKAIDEEEQKKKAAAAGGSGGGGGSGAGGGDTAKSWAKRRRGSVVTGSIGKWEVHKDPNTGKVFYFNPQTKQSRWDKPTEASSGGGGGPKGGAKGGDTAASWAKRRRGSIVTGSIGMWEVHKDPNSGSTFYYNKATKESQWEKPAAMQPKEVAAPGAAKKAPDWKAIRRRSVADDGGSKNPNASWFAGVDPANMSPADAMAAATAMHALAQAGWKQFHDPVSGKNYFRNEAKDLTQWNVPQL